MVASANCLRFDLDMVEALGRRLQPDATVVQEDRNLVMAPGGVLDLDSEDGLDAAYLAIAEHRFVYWSWSLPRCWNIF